MRGSSGAGPLGRQRRSSQRQLVQAHHHLGSSSSSRTSSRLPLRAAAPAPQHAAAAQPRCAARAPLPRCLLQCPAGDAALQQPRPVTRQDRVIAACVATDAPHDQGQPAAATAQQPEAAHAGASSGRTPSQGSEGASPSSSSSSSSSSSNAGTSTSGVAAGPQVVIKVLSEPGELDAVARLRAEAYYADDRSRFAASFKKQFAAQEAESLRQRTTPTSSSQRPQLCDCMVAVEPPSGAVVGCIDIRLPQSCTGMRTIGVPEEDAAGCYLLNVVVCEERRGQGVGRALMRAAMARAVHHWGAQRLYTHVEADNEVAVRLYKGCGFEDHSSESKYANASNLGRLVLLMATTDVVEQLA